MGFLVPMGDGGTTEIWVPLGGGTTHDLIGIAVTKFTYQNTPTKPTVVDAVEHWLVFEPGVEQSFAGLRPFPAGLAPYYAPTPHQHKVKFQDSAHSKGWMLHQDGDQQPLSFSDFATATLDRLVDAYGGTPASLKPHCRGFTGTWSRRPLVAGSGGNPQTFYENQLVTAEATPSSDRVFRVRKTPMGGLLGRIYAEAPSGGSRRIHQYADPDEGIIEDGGGMSHYKYDGSQSLANFLQDKLSNHPSWHFSSGTVAEVALP